MSIFRIGSLCRTSRALCCAAVVAATALPAAAQHETTRGQTSDSLDPLAAVLEDFDARIARLEAKAGLRQAPGRSEFGNRQAVVVAPVPASVPAPAELLVELDAAERRLAVAEARLAELQALEAKVLENIESSMREAETESQQILAMVASESQRLEGIREAQAGKLDVGLIVDNAARTLVSMDLPTLIGGLQRFLVNMDDMAGMDSGDVFGQFSQDLEEVNVGALLIELGESLHGYNLGETLLAMSAEYEGVALPPEAAQMVQALNQFGALGFVRMGQNATQGVSIGSALWPMIDQMEGLNPGTMLYQMANEMPGRTTPAFVSGVGMAMEGLDPCMVLTILAEELDPVSVHCLLSGVEAALLGKDLGECLAVVGEPLTGVDLGEILIRLGHELQCVSASTLCDSMAIELDGVRFGDCVAELEQGIEAMGLGAVDLPAVLKGSGETLAHLQIPRRTEGLQNSVGQLAYFLDQMRDELGMVTRHRESQVAAAPTQSAPARTAPMLTEDQLEQALQHLLEGGLTEDHPAVMKARRMLEETRSLH